MREWLALEVDPKAFGWPKEFAELVSLDVYPPGESPCEPVAKLLRRFAPQLKAIPAEGTVTVRGQFGEDVVGEGAALLAAAFREAARFGASGDLHFVGDDGSRGTSIRVGRGKAACTFGAVPDASAVARAIASEESGAVARLPHFRKKKEASDARVAALQAAAPRVEAVLGKGLAPELRVRELSPLGPTPALAAAIRELPEQLDDETVDALLPLLADSHGTGTHEAENALLRSRSDHAGARALAVLSAVLSRTLKVKLTSGGGPKKLEDAAIFTHAGRLMRIAGSARHEPAIPAIVWVYRNHPASRMRAEAGLALLLAGKPPVVLSRAILDEIKPKVDALLKKTKWRAAPPTRTT
jgi:hypothetical protein